MMMMMCPRDKPVKPTLRQWKSKGTELHRSSQLQYSCSLALLSLFYYIAVGRPVASWSTAIVMLSMQSDDYETSFY